LKRPRKKNVIPPSRLSELKREGVVYEIRCGTHDCGCDNPSAGCRRGFFSLFIQAINGIAFAKRFHLPYFVNFGHTNFSYSQPSNTDQNFWNYFFEQPIRSSPAPSTVVINELIEDYPLRIWDRDYIRGVAQVMSKELVYTDALGRAFDEVSSKFRGRRMLGVHFRSTDHPGEILPVNILNYFREIGKRIGQFDNIFLATDDHAILLKFNEHYGDKLISNDVLRSKTGASLHGDMAHTDRYRLGLDALVDCYALSQCQEAILTQSNLSYAALLFNPELKYKLMERFPTKLNRLLTLSLYYLDKWNIRKW
jgi:hypothetical protein